MNEIKILSNFIFTYQHLFSYYFIISASKYIVIKYTYLTNSIIESAEFDTHHRIYRKVNIF